MQESEVILWGSDKIVGADGSTTTVYFQKPTPGSDFMTPGSSPTFRKVRSSKPSDKLDFLSLMLALFCGTASLPHILIRYYTVKDQLSARKSTVVGIAAIGFFYVLTLYLGLGAMTSGTLDVTDSNMSAPLLARSFNELLFAMISAVAFTTVLGTVSGLIMAASGAVAHDLMTNFLKIKMDEFQKVRAAKIAALCVGVVAMGLGIAFSRMNVNFLVGWAFNIAASANLPSLVMLLFWKRTTKQGITASILVGMVSSLAWILLERAGVQGRLRPESGVGARALQPAGHRHDPAWLPGAGCGVAGDPAGGAQARAGVGRGAASLPGRRHVAPAAGRLRRSVRLERPDRPTADIVSVSQSTGLRLRRLDVAHAHEVCPVDRRRVQAVMVPEDPGPRPVRQRVPDPAEFGLSAVFAGARIEARRRRCDR